MERVKLNKNRKFVIGGDKNAEGRTNQEKKRNEPE